MKGKKSTSSSLRHRLLLQQESEASDGAGGYTRSWTDVGYVWAEVMPLSGKEYLFADKLQAESTHVIRIRFRDDITTRHRFLFDSRVFAIQAIRNIYEFKDVLEIIAVEGIQN